MGARGTSRDGGGGGSGSVGGGQVYKLPASPVSTSLLARSAAAAAAAAVSAPALAPAPVAGAGGRGARRRGATTPDGGDGVGEARISDSYGDGGMATATGARGGVRWHWRAGVCVHLTRVCGRRRGRASNSVIARSMLASTLVTTSSSSSNNNNSSRGAPDVVRRCRLRAPLLLAASERPRLSAPRRAPHTRHPL